MKFRRCRLGLGTRLSPRKLHGCEAAWDTSFGLMRLWSAAAGVWLASPSTPAREWPALLIGRVVAIRFRQNPQDRTMDTSWGMRTLGMLLPLVTCCVLSSCFPTACCLIYCKLKPLLLLDGRSAEPEIRLAWRHIVTCSNWLIRVRALLSPIDLGAVEWHCVMLAFGIVVSRGASNEKLQIYSAIIFNRTEKLSWKQTAFLIPAKQVLNKPMNQLCIFVFHSVALCMTWIRGSLYSSRQIEHV